MADAVTQGDEPLEAAHRHGDDVGTRLVLTQPDGQQVQSAVVAAQDDEQPALALIGQHHEVDRIRACGRAVELLDVPLGRPGLHQLHQTGLLEAQDVVPDPRRMMAHDAAQLRERRRAPHQQAEQAKALCIGEDADGVDGADVADLFQGTLRERAAPPRR